MKEELNLILADLTGQPISKIQMDTERDYYMTCEQARQYGIIDEIILKRQ
jgi:ATP-dependent Clp protease protease subunit